MTDWKAAKSAVIELTGPHPSPARLKDGQTILAALEAGQKAEARVKKLETILDLAYKALSQPIAGEES